MKLTANNIKFIDRYLENSGVKYFDIRVEMVDHIASALEDREGDFYDNFRGYMVGHKSQLLSSNRRFKNAAIGTALKKIGYEMIGPWFLIPLSMMLGGLYFKGNVTDDFMEMAEDLYGITFIVLWLYFVYIRIFRKNIAFSVADKVMYAGLLITWLASKIFTTRQMDNDVKLAGFVFFTSFTIAIISAFYKIVSNYKKQYHAEATPQNIG
jgi:hypothetical protein